MINGFTGRYGFLSNFYVYPIQWRDRILRSAEHAYQSEKTTDELERETIYRAGTPADAKRLGGKKHLKHLAPDWDSIKDGIMLQVLRAKFQDSELRKLFLETRNEELIETNWWGDIYWGVCNGRGKNKLGYILMQVRGEIQRENQRLSFELLGDS
jgi:ribA/ribD-fused uncharacterized protein